MSITDKGMPMPSGDSQSGSGSASRSSSSNNLPPSMFKHQDDSLGTIQEESRFDDGF